MDINEYVEICKYNRDNIYSKYNHFWDEDCVSDMLAYCFQDERIFKRFLYSISDEEVYCGEKKYNLKDLASKLEFKKYHFPRVRVLTQTKSDVKRKIDILIEGKNFLCVIEVKFGSEEHNEQCQEYKEEIEKLCGGKKTPICIYLDTEHSGKKTNEIDFCNDNKYNGYYLAWFGKNVLPTLEYACNLKLDSEFKDDILTFYNFIREVECDNDQDLRSEIKTRRENLITILNKLTYGTALQKQYNEKRYNIYYDTIEINKKTFLEKYEYLNMLLTPEEIEKKLDAKLKKEYGNIYPRP